MDNSWLYSPYLRARIRSIDLDRLSELEQFDVSQDRRLVISVLHLFMESTPALMENLAAAFFRDDRRSLASCAHTLKASAANIGARRLRGLCLELETSAAEGFAPDLLTMNSEIEREYEVIVNDMIQLLAMAPKLDERRAG